MSLQVIAKDMASRGRGGDTMLVHMAPSEVAGLQALAMAHGGTLTTNPDTGLPEANFLKRFLPMIIGAGLTAMTGGAAGAAIIPGLSNAATIGLGVGALQTARTGSLKKGLMAGLGAYGGAGLASGLAQTGIDAAAAPEFATSQAGLKDIVAPEAGFQASTPAGITDPLAQKYVTDILNTTKPYVDASNAASTAYENASFADRLGTMGKGIKSLATEPGRNAFMTNIGGTKGLLQFGGAAAAPAISSLMGPKATTQPPKDTEQFRFDYDPNRDVPPYRAGDLGEFRFFSPRYSRLAADGGLMNLPVERMSDRNDAQMAMTNGPQMYAAGGMSHLGDYSDGGRLLRGPGDGVSDDIPATIADKRPARLADGEFVVPARIVSELGNGSTEAGARKLYAMMDRVQNNRAKTVGKGKVAVNSRSDKLLPA